MHPPTPQTVFCLHFLGGSARQWQGVAARLPAGTRCVGIDLPGFGDAAGSGPRDVAGMADHAAAVIRAHAAERWTLVGHSMGGKVAAVLARRAEDGEAGLQGLAGIVLLAASPPGPEPLHADMRREMLGWFSQAPESGRSRDEARTYIERNVAVPLAPDVLARGVDDVLRADPAAWRAWLEHGSREDWAARVGLLRTPAIIVAGSTDPVLGAAAQATLVAPCFARARLVTLPGCGHLPPLECPEVVARLVVDAPGVAATPEAPHPGPAWRALLGSGRVSERTRAVLLARDRADDPAAAPRAMSAAQRATLAAVCDRLVPQPDAARIDLAARIDARLAEGLGDGWRMASMPADAEACRAGLDTLDAAARAGHGAGFAELGSAAQDALLHAAATAVLGEDRAGALPDGAPGPGRLDAGRMHLWFEELRANAVRAYVAHPATLAAMGYSGIGYGGDAERLSGFTALGIGERESWEPEPARAASVPGQPAAPVRSAAPRRSAAPAAAPVAPAPARPDARAAILPRGAAA